MSEENFSVVTKFILVFQHNLMRFNPLVVVSSQNVRNTQRVGKVILRSYYRNKSSIYSIIIC